MELMHYSRTPLEFDYSRLYMQNRPHTFNKPSGFWVSVTGDGDWPSWCRGEEFDLDRLKCPHRVILCPHANMLHLDTAESLDSFHLAYSIETEYERRNNDLYKQKHWPVDWQRVAREYDGIIIAPYQWSRRLDAYWYYGWDCASGCIWTTGVIKEVTAI